MSQPVIRVDGLSKRYQLGTIGYGSLQHDLKAWWARTRGKEDPNSRIGERSRLDLHGEFWALRDVGFEVQQGDRVGIIGRNGAGKSTLLKLLSRVTSPTSGSIRVRGRIASLLEVGTGFHPELTGRENVYLNGAILGMRRREIQAKFEEIVEFAGVERFIDTPVKRYSSGMYVRLAFSVAAHLDSEILIVDEVLAVGDAEFQKKCLGKMQQISLSDGRTILFVSHGVALLESICNKGIVLQNGCRIATEDDRIGTAVAKYLERTSRKLSSAENLVASVIETQIENLRSITYSSGFSIRSIVQIREESGPIDFVVTIATQEGTKVLHQGINLPSTRKESVTEFVILATIPGKTLNVGSYQISITLGRESEHVLYHDPAVAIVAIQKDAAYQPWNPSDSNSLVFLELGWEITNASQS